MSIIIRAFFVLLLAAPAWALTIDTPLPDAAQEARARALFSDMRCVVCQSESLAESQAEVARDMRRVIRERVAAGESNEAIRQYLVSRYGDFILMQPPLNPSTAVLWLAPLCIVLLAALLAARYFRRRPS